MEIGFLEKMIYDFYLRFSLLVMRPSNDFLRFIVFRILFFDKMRTDLMRKYETFSNIFSFILNVENKFGCFTSIHI